MYNWYKYQTKLKNKLVEVHMENVLTIIGSMCEQRADVVALSLSVLVYEKEITDSEVPVRPLRWRSSQGGCV